MRHRPAVTIRPLGVAQRRRPTLTAVADEEHTLVARAAKGDRPAFEQLYRAHADALFGFLVRRTTAEDAEDLVAETFTRALQAIERFEWRGQPFRAWLYRIARNLLVGSGRSSSGPFVPLITCPETPDDSFGEHTERMELAEATWRLRRALDELSDLHRSVVELRFLQERNVTETAVILDSTEDAVRALTYRAIRELRRRYLKASARPGPTLAQAGAA